MKTITKIALILGMKPEVFNHAIFGIENCRTTVRGIKPRQFPIKELEKPNYKHEIMRNITALGSSPFYALLLLFLIVIQEYSLFFMLLLGILLTILGVVITRLIYYKDRPKQQTHSNILERIDASAFPSWHTAQATFFSITMAVTISNPLALLFFIL